MNGDIAHTAAYRHEDERFEPLQRYCVKCTTYKPVDQMNPEPGSRCLDCTHAPGRARAITVALRSLSRGHHKAALVIMALSLDEQARAEGLDVPSVTAAVRRSHDLGFRERLFEALWTTDPWCVMP